MLCPRCNGSLFTSSKDSVEIEVCTDCGGIWLDADELKTITEQARAEVDSHGTPKVEDTVSSVQESSDMKCPKCNDVSLNAFIYAFDSGVELDRCPQCSGLWLDKSELEQITAYMIKSDNCPMADALQTRGQEEGVLSRYSSFFKYLAKFLMQDARGHGYKRW